MANAKFPVELGGNRYWVIAPKDTDPEAIADWAAPLVPTWKPGAHYLFPGTQKPGTADYEGSYTPEQEAEGDKDVLRSERSDLMAQREVAEKNRRRALMDPNLSDAERTWAANQPDKDMEKLDEQIAERSYALGEDRPTTGRDTGALAGAVGGAALGGAVAGPPGALIGGLGGAAIGAGAGTYAYDLPKLEEFRDVSPGEALAMVGTDVVVTAVVDGAFMLLLGPAGRPVAKVARKLLPNAQVWDAFAQRVAKQVPVKTAWRESGEEVTKRKIKKRAAVADPRTEELVTKEVARAKTPLDPRVREAGRSNREDIITEFGERTKAETGTAEYPLAENVRPGGATTREASAQQVQRRRYATNQAAVDEAVRDMQADAVDRTFQNAPESSAMGDRLAQMTNEARTRLRERTRGLFGAVTDLETATDANPSGLAPFRFQASKELREAIEDEVKQLANTHGIGTGEAAKTLLQKVQRLLSGEPIDAQTALDVISGLKSEIWAVDRLPGQPAGRASEIMSPLLKKLDEEFVKAVRDVDPRVASNLLKARAEYKRFYETFGSPDMKDLLSLSPSKVGSALVSKSGGIENIRAAREAMRQGLKLAGVTDAKAVRQQVREFEEGMMRGFISEHLKNPENFVKRLRTDEKLRSTLVELLAGRGVDRKSAGKLLLQLNRVEQAADFARKNLTPKDVSMLREARVAPITVGVAAAGPTGLIGAVMTLLAYASGRRAYLWSVAAQDTQMAAGMLGTIERVLRMAPKIVGQKTLTPAEIEWLQQNIGAVEAANRFMEKYSDAQTKTN